MSGAEPLPAPAAPARADSSRGRLASVLLAAMLVVRLLLNVLSSEGIGWDFANYYRAGSLLLQGQAWRLYRADRAAAVVGFPLTSFLFAPLAAFPPRVALIVFKAQSALFLAAALFLLYGPFRRLALKQIRSDLVLPLYLLLCLLYSPFWFVFTVGGQATPFSLLMLAAFHRSYVRSQAFRAAFFLSLAALIKPVLAVSLVVLIVTRDARLFSYAALILGAAGALSVALLGWPLHVEWLQLVRESGEGWSEPWWNNGSIWNVFFYGWRAARGAPLESALPVTGAVLQLVFVLRLAVLSWLLALGWHAWRQPLPPGRRRHFVCCLAILAPLLLSGIVWPHYLAFLFIPLIFVLISAPGLPLSAQALGWLTFASALSVQSRFAQRCILMMLTGYPRSEALTAGLLGSCTLILALLLWTIYHRQILSTADAS